MSRVGKRSTTTTKLDILLLSNIVEICYELSMASPIPQDKQQEIFTLNNHLCDILTTLLMTEFKKRTSVPLQLNQTIEALHQKLYQGIPTFAGIDFDVIIEQMNEVVLTLEVLVEN